MTSESLPPESGKVYILRLRDPGVLVTQMLDLEVVGGLAGSVTLVIALLLWASVSSSEHKVNTPCSASLTWLLLDLNEIMLWEL